nr:OprO/OprP family phosphate-selective porin [Acidobacteriota bacterium]
MNMTHAGRRLHAAVTRIAWVLLLAVTAVTGAARPVEAQVARLYYQEVQKEGRYYVFNTPERYKQFQETGDMGPSITLIRQGPSGETVVAENETALDLFNFKHNLPAYERPTPPPAPPSVPTALRIGQDGELKFGALLQVWYIFDDSPVGTGVSWLGNDPGQNTFRIRRAELKMSGKFSPDWGFELMIDPAKNLNLSAGQDGKVLQDLAISYLGFKGQEIAIGQKKIVLTWEGLRSSSELDF